MQATYADVAADSSLSQSSDCEYRKTVRAELFDALLHNAQRQQQHQQSQKKKVRSAVAEEECRKRAAQLERILFDRFFFEDIGRYAERLRSLAHNLRVNMLVAGTRFRSRHGFASMARTALQRAAQRYASAEVDRISRTQQSRRERRRWRAGHLSLSKVPRPQYVVRFDADALGRRADDQFCDVQHMRNSLQAVRALAQRSSRLCVPSDFLLCK